MELGVATYKADDAEGIAGKDGGVKLEVGNFLIWVSEIHPTF